MKNQRGFLDDGFTGVLAILGLILCIATGIAIGIDTKEKNERPLPKQPARIKVERIGVVHDDLAYNDERGIYIIKDDKTGVEYIGVSGIGISEAGSYFVGKSTSEYER